MESPIIPDVTTDSDSDSSGTTNGLTGGQPEDDYNDSLEEDAATKVRKRRFLDDQMDDVFEPVLLNELKLVLLGEIVSAEGFDASPVCVHYLFELPKGWRNDSVVSNLQGITNSCYSTIEGMCHFSFSFFIQLIFSLDTVEENKSISRPVILISVASMLDSTRVKFDGYGYISLPSHPGTYNFKIQTWRPKPRTIEERMAECFVDVAPSLQDIRAAHLPYFEGEECRRANRLGLQTEPSGFVTLRFHVFHQVPADIRAQSSKLILMERMNSSTIVKSVQTVIDAFQRARKRAENAKLGMSTKLTLRSISSTREGITCTEIIGSSRHLRTDTSLRVDNHTIRPVSRELLYSKAMGCLRNFRVKTNRHHGVWTN
ncbi:unnamed protein product [Allacma fusca]|uniref:Uncharacterized protein n=1 Tax=Allacma fusca TaxID=39272 RepID=A0A8J2LEV5_9HEXA|nr:unnamed protein product [Allacma fusca]